MASIKRLKLFFALQFLLSIAACAYAANPFSQFHNNGKKFTAISDMSSKDWHDPQELERVWQNSIIRIPTKDGKFISSQVKDFTSLNILEDKKFPTVIYLHGCSGIWPGTIHRINFLAIHGFAVVAPPSLAREKYPKSCDVNLVQGGLYRGTLRIRQNDAGYAITQARKLPWVDEKNVFLMGLSEGGITTATFYATDKSKSVNARIVEGWSCTSTWNEYRGIRAPKNEPVLTLLGEKDPWFQNPYTNGECTQFLNKKNGSQSIVYRKGNLSFKHELLEDDSVKKSVIKFLQKHLN